MRVLHVLDTIDPAGAGPVEAARLYCTAPAGDYHAEVLTLDADANRWRDAWAVPIHCVGRSRVVPRYSAGLVPWLRQNGRRYDAVIVHSVWGYHLVGVSRGLPAEVPYFLILHGSLNPWFRRTYPRKHLKKVAFWRAMTGKAVEGARAVLYLCPEEKRLADASFQIRAHGEEFVPLGTLPRRASPEPFFARFPSLRGKRILLFLGRICFMKGCDLLLDAFAKVAASTPDAHLVMCGTDHESWQGELTRRAERLNIAHRVTWTGPLFNDERWPALTAAELLVLPSRCETFPIVVLEALSCGTPALVTRDVNIHPQIERWGAGPVCEANVESIKSALRTWLDKDEGARKAASERASACHANEFDLRGAVRTHIEAIQRNPPKRTVLRTGGAGESLNSTHSTSRTLKEAVRAFLPKDLAPHRILSGPLRGSRIFTSWHDYPGAILGTTERSLLRWFQANVRSGETWIDVGAHYGYTAIALSRLTGPDGRVYAFEPVRSTAAALERTRELNSLDRLTVVPLALSDRPGILELPATRGMADSSLSSSAGRETISTVALDALWFDLVSEAAPIHGIKIDVQGMELDALRGMLSLLQRWAPKLIVEIHACVGRAEVAALLEPAGYATPPRPIDGDDAAGDRSYFFAPRTTVCEYSYTR